MGNADDEDLDMFEDMEKEAMQGVEVSPKHTAEKLTMLNLLFDLHKVPIPSNSQNQDDEAHNQVDLVKLRKLIQEENSRNLSEDDITVADFDTYFSEFIAQKTSQKKGPSEQVYINNVEFSTIVDSLEECILKDERLPHQKN